MGKTTQQLYNEYTHEKKRLSERKSSLESEISDKEGKVKKLKAYKKEVDASNEEIKPLVSKFATIGEFLKEVRPEGKPMDNGDFITESEDIGKCSTYLTNLSTEITDAISKLETQISTAKSQLSSVNSSISYYSGLISGLRM